MNSSFPRITVNGQAIPPEAVEFEFGRLIKFYAQHMPEEQVRAQLDALRQKAVEQTIGVRLLMEEAEHVALAVSDAEVDEQLARMQKEAGGPAKFMALMQRQKLTEPALREQIKRGRRMDKLVEQIAAGVPEPTEDDMRAHFDAHQEEYTRVERVQAQHILIKPAAETDEAKAAARAKLEEIRQRVQGGGAFASEAAAHSECPSGRQAGGSLGWFSRGMMVPPFDQAAFSLQVGELSGVIETAFGYHLIQKTGHEPAAPADYAEARESIRDFLRHAARGTALAEHVDALKAKARIEIV